MRTPTLELAHRQVWVTGASSGIGESLAHAFAAQGAHLILSARRQSKLEAVRDAILARYPSCSVRIVPLDMTRPETFADAVEAAAADGLDVLVHNAGISQRTPMLETDPDDERRVLETNFFGPAHLTRLAVPAMQQRPGPSQLVVISSVAGLVGTPLRTAYSASKFAVVGWFEAAEVELWESDVGVTLVFPGFVKTDIAKNAVGGRENDPNIEGGLDPDDVARRIVSGVRTRKRRLTIAGTEGWAPWLRLLAPGLLLRTLRQRFDA